MVEAFLNTTTTCATALILGLIAGLATSLLHWTPLRRYVYALAAGGNAVPVTALLPVFIGLFGITGFVVPAVAFPTWLLSTVALLSALRQLSLDRRQAFQLGRMSLLSYLVNVAFWEILSPFVAAVRVAAPLTIALVIALDYFLGVIDGLGFRIAEDSMYYRDTEMWISIAVVSLFSLLLIKGLDALQRTIDRRSTNI